MRYKREPLFHVFEQRNDKNVYYSRVLTERRKNGQSKIASLGQKAHGTLANFSTSLYLEGFVGIARTFSEAPSVHFEIVSFRLTSKLFRKSVIFRALFGLLFFTLMFTQMSGSSSFCEHFYLCLSLMRWYNTNK